jgi:hypothetical protein
VSRWLQTVSSFADVSTMKISAKRSSETSVHTRSTQCPISEDDFLQESNCLHHELSVTDKIVKYIFYIKVSFLVTNYITFKYNELV